MTHNNSYATGKTVRFSIDPNEIGTQIPDNEHVRRSLSSATTKVALTTHSRIQDNDPAMRPPVDPTEEGEDAPFNVRSSRLLVDVGVSADPTVQDGQDEPWHPEGTCVEPFGPGHGGNTQVIPLRYVLQLELVPRLNQSSTESILRKMVVIAAAESSQNPEPSEEEKGVTVWWPMFYFAAFLFGLYLSFIIYATYVLLCRVFFS